MKRTPLTRKEHPLTDNGIDPQRWVDNHGDYLYRYALRNVRRPDVAEDLVQETLLAAWRGRDGFVGRAKERSWLTAILKRKVIDWLRLTIRERKHRAAGGPDERGHDPFGRSGKWRTSPKRWLTETPDSDAERAEFWDVIHGCVSKLPPRLRETFVLWHLDEKPGDEVCQAIDITPGNMWVMLHRARLRMWQCLTKNWYGLEPTNEKGG